MDLRPLLLALACSCTVDTPPTTTPTDLSCFDDVLMIGESWSGSTEGETNAQWSTCGGSAGRDASVVFEADAAYDDVSFWITAAFDTVLRVGSACAGEELACADNAGTREVLTVPMSSGEQVVLSVDGYAHTEFGEFTVHSLVGVYDEFVCDDEIDDDKDGLIDCDDPGCADDPACQPDCPMFTLTEAGDTVSTRGRLDQFQPSCIDDSRAPDVSWSFTAPEAGTYTFRTAGSDFDTVLSVLDGCVGAVLDCNDDDKASKTKNDRASRVVVSLEAAQTVIVVVDGFSQEQGEAMVSVAR